MAFMPLVFALLLTSVLANPDPEPLPEESDYDGFEYEEEPVDYGQPPEFMYPDPQDIKGVEGGKVTIPCQLANKSPYVLIVKKEMTDDEEEKLLFVGEVKVPRSRRFKLNDGMVEISSLRPSDSGNYICLIQDTPPIEVVHHVDVQYSPKITHHSEAKQQVLKGESVKLECEASGNPTPTIRWSKEEGKLPSGVEEEEVTWPCTLIFILLAGKLPSGVEEEEAHLHCLRLVQDPHCPWCRSTLETREHFLLQCPRFHSQRILLHSQLITL